MISEKLTKIQTQIKAPKNLYNSFGKYNYRNAESIYESVKPFLREHNVSLTLSDDAIAVGDRVYIKATAVLIDNETGESWSVSALARESLDKKGMDDSQITGTASSYARKYALNGMFLLDDTKDADTDEYHKQTQQDNKPTHKQEEKTPDDIGNMIISKIKVDIIKKKCADEGVPEEKVLTLYHLKSFEEMTEKKFSNAINNFDKIKEM